MGLTVAICRTEISFFRVITEMIGGFAWSVPLASRFGFAPTQEVVLVVLA